MFNAPSRGAKCGLELGVPDSFDDQFKPWDPSALERALDDMLREKLMQELQNFGIAFAPQISVDLENGQHLHVWTNRGHVSEDDYIVDREKGAVEFVRGV